MKRNLIILTLMVLVTLAGCGIGARYQILKTQEDIKIKSPKKELRKGEKLTYKIEWMGMDVGIVTLSVEGIKKQNGSKAYHLLGTVTSTQIISKLYKIEDEISSYLDVENLYTLRFEKKQREGGYRSDEYTDFDQKNGKARYFSRLNESKKEYEVPKNIQDPLSCLYYFRLLEDVDVGKSLFANVNADEKSYLLEAKIHKKGLLKIPGVGEWPAFLVEPLPWFQGRVERKAKATIWFSADEKRIPLLVTTRSIPFVGTIVITLQNIE